MNGENTHHFYDRASRWTKAILLLLSAMLLIFVTHCYFTRFDFCAAITIFPPWCWLLAGFVLAMPSTFRKGRRAGVCVLLMWLVFLAVFCDSPLALLRQFRPAPQAPSQVRIVTLNCAGAAGAASEVADHDPDIVLFQESPRKQSVQQLALELYGAGSHLAWYVDTSIIARGDVMPQRVPDEFRGNFVHALVRLDSERELDVICLRLRPPPVRVDLWSLDCWKAYQRDRADRRRELKRITDYAASLSNRHPIIIGGDFNTPPGDAVFALLSPDFSDAFQQAGRGWGRTILNEKPLLRIDQIWLGPSPRPLNVQAHRTENSDHRMVICDLDG